MTSTRPLTTTTTRPRRIVVVGGGYAGLYTAWHLERLLRRGEAEVTVVDQRPYMTYQPFLPEVASGGVEARHTVVPLRRHLRRTRVVLARATRVDHASRTVHARGPGGEQIALPYDDVVLTAGAVTRTAPVPGLAEHGIGLKTVEEAVAIRDHLLTAFDHAATLPRGAERSALLGVTVVGGGFSGVEVYGELLSLAHDLLAQYPEIASDEVALHLVEATERVLPEVSEARGRWVVEHLRGRGGHVHLGARLSSLEDRRVVLADGRSWSTGLVVWAAGNASAPVVARHTDLPIDARGRLLVGADLRVVEHDGEHAPVVEGAWAAGDAAAVPDLAVGPHAVAVPNAQHAVRQARVLARNLVAVLRGRPTRSYRHASLGVVATLGRGHGLFEYRRLAVRGWPAWAMHRGYHLLAVPSWERKVRVGLGWLAAAVGGRDVASLTAVRAPRAEFESAAAPVASAPPTDPADPADPDPASGGRPADRVAA